MIIEENGLSIWCSAGHFVDKSNGKPRLVVDLVELNKHMLRPMHGFPSASELRDSLDPGSRLFCVLDCIQGYHQLLLDAESSKLTTFIVSTGDGSQRYRFKRAPMGLNSSGDEFNKRTDQAFLGIPGVGKLVDDLLVQAASMAELKERVEMVLTKAREAGVTLSPTKRQVGPTVRFGGYII